MQARQFFQTLHNYRLEMFMGAHAPVSQLRASHDGFLNLVAHVYDPKIMFSPAFAH